MSLDKISSFAITVVIMAATAGNLDRLNHWVQVATDKVLWESRASAWGSPRFWHKNENDLRAPNDHRPIPIVAPIEFPSSHGLNIRHLNFRVRLNN